MLNFIVCEDNQAFTEFMKKTIDNFMMNYETEYKIYFFEKYGKEFEEMVTKEIGFKVYFLDLVTNGTSGLDAVRIIREKYNDWVSMLIVVTSHEEYRYEALSKRLAVFDFVNKLEGCHEVIREDLGRIIDNYDRREKSLTFEYNHVFHKVEFREIICIEKELDSKRCIVKTTYGTKTMPGTLNSAIKNLDSRFIKIHRSLIINIDKVSSYEPKRTKLIFKDGTHTHLVARDKKKELIIRVRTSR